MTTLYTITNLTNLHVGSGDINFDIIDNQVQKDSISELPIIHSSSLKGAFREHFEKKLDKDIVNHIFGKEGNDGSAGNYSFFEARLLTRPVRSNVMPYFNATTPQILKEFLEFIDQLNIKIDDNLKTTLEKLSKLKVDKPIIFNDLKDVILEDFKAQQKEFKDVSELKNFLGENLAIFNDRDFKKLDLPVIARNKLNNGKSENLWYEEVVPPKSKFYFAIVKDKKIDEFENILKSDTIQIGANKSIGYGFCKIKGV